MPYFKISTPPEHANKNRGSVRDLVQYLEKENQGKDPADKEYFFNHTDDIVFPEEVISVIDNNRKGLKKDETKFYEMSLSFSQPEISAMRQQHAQLTDRHRAIREYIRNTMNTYADHFDRGLTAKDVVYFAKIESNRIYPNRPYSDETKMSYSHNFKVKAEISKLISDGKLVKAKAMERQYIRDHAGTIILPGQTKTGNTHVHIVVSRRDVTQKISLSPLANSPGGYNKLNGRLVKIGFERDPFVEKLEKLFDQHFSYSRNGHEKYRNLRTAKVINSTVRDLGRIVDEPEKFLQRVSTQLVEQTIKKHLTSYLSQHGLKHLIAPIQQSLYSNRANLVNLAARNLSNNIAVKAAAHGIATTIPTPVGAVVKAITVAYHSLLSDPKTKGRDKGMALER